MTFHITKEHEEDLLNALKEFPTNPIYNEKVNSYYYGAQNWFYVNDYACTLDIVTDKFNFNIRIDPENHCIILIDNDDYDFDDMRNCCSCKFYKSEEEYFMASTVKAIPIPYSILKRSYEFFQYVKAEFK